MSRILIVYILAALAMSCSRGPQETAETRAAREEHVRQMEELETKRQETVAKIQAMEFPALMSLMEEDSDRGIEPFNSPAYREVTNQRGEERLRLLEEIKAREAVPYLPLLALRKIDSGGYESLESDIKLHALLTEFGRSQSYNKWGLPHLYWEDAAEALVELGKEAEPGLKKYLKDRSPAPVWGSEEVAEYEAYQYRRCDYALALLMEIWGQSVKELPRDPEARDALIQEIE